MALNEHPPAKSAAYIAPDKAKKTHRNRFGLEGLLSVLVGTMYAADLAGVDI